ncbi:hypothetical protein CHS0354_027289 [Potamilus streckersoni]|uniref:FAM20 C-terminal domain-containing protein n=1 Tax=Potamilus streckersoni TaxID=2493646 RepID=A0AAE0W849_9BIVA|nr:hypothetical protein CHS0354_027289 [Potamilus streckersoni]
MRLFVLLLGGLVLVWLLNSTWNWETILVAIKIGSNHFPSEGGHKYQMRQGININYHQIWEKCNQAINGESIFIPTTDVEEIIDALRSAKIVKADIYSPSTSSEYKWILILEGGQLVHFKPALINKTVKESGNCFSGCGHAEYEVAGFTLNRILQLGNMPYATGRLISWNKEIKSVATKALRSSVTIRGDGDVCITWSCYPKRKSRCCFGKGVIHGVVIYWIRNGIVVQRAKDKGIWRHEFHALGGFLKNFASILPGNRTFCDRVREMEPYQTNPFSFRYILDMAAIDFLMLNYAGGKHTYIAIWNKNIYLDILLDYGLSIRKSLYRNLLKYSAILTEVFDGATKDDPLYPLLLLEDTIAMQQRLNTIIALVQICLKKYKKSEVFL